MGCFLFLRQYFFSKRFLFLPFLTFVLRTFYLFLVVRLMQSIKVYSYLYDLIDDNCEASLLENMEFFNCFFFLFLTFCSFLRVKAHVLLIFKAWSCFKNVDVWVISYFQFFGPLLGTCPVMFLYSLYFTITFFLPKSRFHVWLPTDLIHCFKSMNFKFFDSLD